MEAIKRGNPLKFTWGDLTILVKPHASSQDRLEVACAKGPAAHFRLVGAIMVLDVKGLTRDGEAIAYAPEELENVPDLDGKNFAFELGKWIWEQTDISGRGDADLKNASRQPLTGSAEPVPSTAAGKVA